MSEFEEFARSQGFGGDFQRGCNGQYKSDLLHFMEKAFMHQQAKINAITKQRDSFIKATHIAMNDVCEHKAKIDELQSRIDKVVHILTYTNHASTPLCNELRDILKGNKDVRV